MKLTLGRPGPIRAALVGTCVALLLVVLLGVVLAPGAPDPMTSTEAIDFTERALSEAGVAAQVGTPERGTFGLGPLAADVWIVPAVVGSQPIAVSVDADGDKALNLADRLGDGTTVLADEEFDALAAFRYDPQDEDRMLPSAVALGAAVAAGVALGGAVRAHHAALPARAPPQL